MSYITLEVEFDHGKIVPKPGSQLPAGGTGLLTFAVAPESTALPRPAGLAKGQFVVPEDFNAPLPADVVKSFEGE